MTCTFPSELATAIITCIFKSGAFSKILEKIISVLLAQYFVVNNFFTECQFG